MPGDLLDYAETEFLLAEAVERGIAVGGTAQSHYNNAIMASITFWGGKVSDANLYLLNPSVDYTTATGNYKQKIGYQKWIALANRGWDAWTEIRRLGHPNLNVVNPPIGGVGSLPLRFYYPLTEQTSNPINWAAAVKAQTGGTSDDVKTKAFLDAIIISSSSVASSLSNPSAVQLPGYILSLPV
ncbi:MAG: SusD/RagB family nutrient-binding outer rane lipoprotein [Chitinophagaceae bacterium]|nr:SusD/RagB family nutrient-binding outer rane lipoprotein [Chitinophagaceae bacterium]